MILQVGKIIFNILSNNPTLKKLVGKKIYPLIADTSTTFPFIVYRRASINGIDTKDRYICKEEAIIEIIIATDNYNESIQIAQAVKDVLHNKRGLIGTIDVKDITLLDASEEYMEDSFIQKLNFKITL